LTHQRGAVGVDSSTWCTVGVDSSACAYLLQAGVGGSSGGAAAVGEAGELGPVAAKSAMERLMSYTSDSSNRDVSGADASDASDDGELFPDGEGPLAFVARGAERSAGDAGGGALSFLVGDAKSSLGDAESSLGDAERHAGRH
jgi:hypothetical protein